MITDYVNNNSNATNDISNNFCDKIKNKRAALQHDSNGQQAQLMQLAENICSKYV